MSIEELRNILESMFQSYQFRQINPDVGSVAVSRPEYDRFNRINSGRSIPTLNHVWLRVQVATIVSIVSIQADQSRLLEIEVRIFLKNGFNRINSGRSIPTKRQQPLRLIWILVSIVSIQADQSRRGDKNVKDALGENAEVSIVSIQADQSRPWLVPSTS